MKTDVGWKEKNRNSTVESPGRQILNQVIKVDIISNKSQLYIPDMTE